ncbi:MAG TPA: hypothetical protein VKB55_16930 [Nocardioidaceae bacterium]|nr:hypothetical protein [Nocardioidaceae bacterium]
MYYPDYMQDLAAAVAQARGEAGEHRRPGPARTSGRHGRRGGSPRWLPAAVADVTILLILYAVLAFHFGVVEALLVLGAAFGLWVAGAAVVTGVLMLVGRKVKRRRHAQIAGRGSSSA